MPYSTCMLLNWSIQQTWNIPRYSMLHFCFRRDPSVILCPNDVCSIQMSVESCQTTTSKVKIVDWRDLVCQSLSDVILFLIMFLVHDMYMSVCLILNSKDCSLWSRPETYFLISVLLITNLSCGDCALSNLLCCICSDTVWLWWHAQFSTMCSQTISTLSVILD